MKHRILTIMFASAFFAPALVKAEVVTYRCSDGNQSEFQVDPAASRVAVKNFGFFRGLEIMPPVSVTPSSAHWQMKDKLFPTCSYMTKVKFYTTTGFSCPSGKGAEVTIQTTCLDGGKGQTTNWCCGQ